MSIEYQVVMLRKILALTFFVTQVFGLYPYAVNRTTFRIEYNCFKFVYSIVLPLIVVYNYYTFGIAILASPASQAVVHSKTLGLITTFYSLFIFVSFFSVYVGQHLTFTNAKSLVYKCTEVMELLKTFSIERMDLRQCFVHFFVKTIAYDIYNLSVLWFHLSRSTNVLSSYPYLPLFLYTPVRLNENIFYGNNFPFSFY